MADINETLRKIKALANGTKNEHEREAALMKFYELMDKHGISMDDIDDETIATYDFKWKGTRERKLLVQIIVMVMKRRDITTYFYRRKGRKVSNTFGLECTKTEKLEIDFMFDFYRDLYCREEETFFTAFLNKHKIFGPPSDEDTGDMSDEERIKLLQLMDGMDDISPHKRLAIEEATQE